MSTDDNNFTAQETSESAVTAQDTVETNEATSAFDKCESINIDDTNLYIHLTAPEGVLPADSYFTVNKTECDSATEALLGAARGEDTFVFESHILDITLYNSDGVQTK